jgi:hypothetical protein
MIAKKIELDTYPVVIHLFIDVTDDEIREYVQKHECLYFKDLFTFTDLDEAMFVYEKNSPEVYLRFRNIDDPAIVAHECLHATAYLMRYIGVRFSKNSEEAYAYLLQTLIDKVYEE